MDKVAEAQRLLKEGKLSPSKATELKAWVDAQYAKAVDPMRFSKGSLGDPRAATGAEAIAEADKRLPERQAKKTNAESAADVQLQEWVREGQPEPRKRAADAELVQQTLESQAGEALAPPEEDWIAKAQAKLSSEQELIRRRQVDYAGLQNLSKDPNLFVPPEYKSRQAAVAPGIKDAIPYVGFEVWYDPSVEMFRRDMGSSLRKAGLDPEKVTDTDPVFKRYADAMWAQAYKKAAEKDRSIVRQSFIKDDPAHGTDAVKAGFQVILGLDRGMRGGAGLELAGTAATATGLGSQEDVQTLRNFREQGPVSAAAEIVSSFLPGSIAGRLAGVLGRALPAGGNAALNIARSGGLGAAAAGGERLVGDVIQNIGDVSRGAEPSVSGEQMASNLGTAALWGGGFGLAGGAVAEGAGALKNRLLEGQRGSAIKTMEEGGIEPSFLWRSEPEAVRAARRRTREAGLGGDTRSMSTKELADRYAQSGAKMQREAGKELASRLESYHAWQEALPNPKQPVTELTDAAVGYMDTLLDDAGRALPGVDIGKVRSLLPQLFKTEEVSVGRVSQMKQAGWRQLPLESKSELGVVMGKPRELTARELSVVLDELDEQARFNKQAAQAGTAPRDRAARELAIAARKVRDRFPSHPKYAPESLVAEHEFGTVRGYSALNTVFSQVKKETGNVLELGGLPREVGLRPKVSERSASPETRASEAAVGELKAITDRRLKSLSPGELDAAVKFSRTLSKRQGVNEAPELSGALEKLRIDNPTQYGTLYRGMPMTESELASFLKSGELRVDYHTPLSYNRDLSSVYPKPKDLAPGQQPVMLRVKDADSGYSLVSDNLSMDLEEVLAPKGSRFELLGTSVEDGKRYFDVRLTSEPSDPLEAALSPKQQKVLDSAIQGYRQSEGGARSDEAILKIAKAAGLEGELKMWAAIEAARRVGAGASEGATLGGGGIRGWVRGTWPELGMKSVKTLNRLKAEPLSQAPRPSAELRALLRRLRGRGGPKEVPPSFALLGMASGGAGSFATGVTPERTSLNLDPALKARVMGSSELVMPSEEMDQEERGILNRMLEAVGRGMAKGMPRPSPAPMAPTTGE